VGALTIGIPSFLLALKPSRARVRGSFLQKTMLDALPAALLIVLNIVVIQILSVIFRLPYSATTTLCSMMAGVMGMLLLTRVARPVTALRGAGIGALLGVFVAGYLFFGHLFEITSILSPLAFIYAPLIITAVFALPRMTAWLKRIQHWIFRANRNNAKAKVKA